MAIDMPQIEINFKRLSVSAVQRSERGIVALIVKDSTDKTFTLKEYKSIVDIESTLFTATNAQYIKDAFAGTPGKVFVVRVDADSTDAVASAITALGSKKYNWIGLAEGTPEEQQALVAYVKEQEAVNKSIKAVVYNATAPDSMHVVNFTTPTITYTNGTSVTGDKFVSRLLGVFAGLPLTRSATYLPFADVLHVEEPVDVEAAVNAGKLVLFNDEEVCRIARSVNSLSTLGENITEDMKKIIIVESMDLIRSDIYSTFKNDYLSKFKNTYDSQVHLITGINSYFATLADEGILDPAYVNTSFVNVEAQREAWLSTGKTEAASWDDATVRNNTYRSNVYLAGKIKILDAMESFEFNITME